MSRSVDIGRCGICNKRFNGDDRKPKFLTCYHTYCYSCLVSIQEERKKTDGGGVEFSCPSCHKVTRVGKKGVRLLHDNVYILVQTDKRKSSRMKFTYLMMVMVMAVAMMMMILAHPKQLMQQTTGQ